MTFTLYIRDKDASALKLCACIAAGADNVDINVVPQGGDVAKKVDLPLPSQGLPALIAENGSVIQECHAAAKLLGGEALSPAALQAAIDELLDLHESTIMPALKQAAPNGGIVDPTVLKALEDILQKHHFLIPGTDKPTLADICVGIDLLSLADIGELPGPVAAFSERIKNLPECSSALQTLQISDWADVAAVSKAAAAATAADAPRLPKPGARNVLITSALPYVNNVPHLGNIIGCVLSADVHSRYCRARGYNSVFICGTDEYGTATETKALEEGATCQEICDKYHAIHKQIYDWFQIDFDKFGRTPTRAQTEITQGIFKRIAGNGAVAERAGSQLFSVALDKFLADRYVVGTCPKCGYEDARGDQCDNCGSLLNPTELRNPRCKFSGTEPVLRETSHLYIDLPQLEGRLRTYIDAASKQGGWSANCVSMTEAWLKGGLKERCITRDLKWGTPVPQDGFRNKVFYVWFDAPIGYVSITANYTPQWRQWWHSPEDVELVQFMGKDNVTFHTIIFPCTLLATSDKWTMMRKISVTEYLNYEGGKFSKSRGTGVFGDGAIASGIPADIFRYYLLATRPEASDSDFRWADLAQRNNSELLKNLGNFINRVVSFTCNQLEAKAPGAPGEVPPLVQALNAEVAGLAAEYLALMEALKIRDGVAKVLQVSSAGNKFLQDAQFWTLPRPEAATFLAAALGLVKLLAAMLQPYMPGTAATVLRMLGGPSEWLSLGDSFEADAKRLQAAVPAGHALGKPELLFSVIAADKVAELQGRFAGTQADAAASAASTATAASQPENASEAATTSTGGAGKAGGAGTAGGKAKKDLPVDISRVDLRVGLITKAAKHPDADSLYVEDIMCGEEAPRVVVSGLVNHIPEPEMQQRLVVVVANLKPANLKGIKSHAMVLAATGADGKVELVDPPAGSKPGDRVSVEGFAGEPDVQLNPKHKVFEAVHPDFSTDDALLACYRGKPLTTALGPCTVKTVKGATIK